MNPEKENNSFLITGAPTRGTYTIFFTLTQEKFPTDRKVVTKNYLLNGSWKMCSELVEVDVEMHKPTWLQKEDVKSVPL